MTPYAYFLLKVNLYTSLLLPLIQDRCDVAGADFEQYHKYLAAIRDDREYKMKDVSDKVDYFCLLQLSYRNSHKVNPVYFS
jgi:hypothetical protein